MKNLTCEVGSYISVHNVTIISSSIVDSNTNVEPGTDNGKPNELNMVALLKELKYALNFKNFSDGKFSLKTLEEKGKEFVLGVNYKCFQTNKGLY